MPPSSVDRDLGKLEEATETLKKSLEQLETTLRESSRVQSGQISKIFSVINQINTKVSSMEMSMSSMKSLSDRVKKLEDNLLFLKGNGKGIAAVLSLLVLVGAGIFHVIDAVLLYLKDGRL